MSTEALSAFAHFAGSCVAIYVGYRLAMRGIYPRHARLVDRVQLAPAKALGPNRWRVKS